MFFTKKVKGWVESCFALLTGRMDALAGRMDEFPKTVEAERQKLAAALAEAEKRLKDGDKAHSDLVQARYELLKVGSRVTESTEAAQKALAESTAALVEKTEAKLLRRAAEVEEALGRKTNTIGGYVHGAVETAKAEVTRFTEERLNQVLADVKGLVAEAQAAIKLAQNRADSVMLFGQKFDVLDDKLNEQKNNLSAVSVSLSQRVEALEKASKAAPAHVRR